MTTYAHRPLVFFLFAAVGCTAGKPCALATDDEIGTETGPDTCEAPLPPGWPATEIDCRVLDCTVDESDAGRPMACTVAMYASPGHWVDLALESSGSGLLPWNELPWDADAGLWESANFYAAGGTDCETIAISESSIGASPDGDRYLDVVCDDLTLGEFDSSRVWLTPNGPVVEP